MEKLKDPIPLTLHDYLTEIATDSKDITFAFDLGHYFNAQPGLGKMLNQGPLCFFVLDYRTKGYYHVGENTRMIMGIPSEAFLEGGIPLYHRQMHEEDLKVFSGILFYKRLQHIQTVKKEERHKYWYSINYRFKRSDGKIVHVLQQFTVLEVNDQGNPLILLGFCTDISHYKQDNKIVDTISKWDDTNGFNCLSRNVYFPASEDNRLSAREIEILKWIMEGLSSKCIADKLYLSFHTVNTHRKNMLEKTNAKNTADLFKYAFKYGLL